MKNAAGGAGIAYETQYLKQNPLPVVGKEGQVAVEELVLGKDKLLDHGVHDRGRGHRKIGPRNAVRYRSLVAGSKEPAAEEGEGE